MKHAIADSWFLDLYKSISEPLATPQDVEEHLEEVEFEEVPDASHPLWNITVNLDIGSGPKRLARKKYLNPGGFESLWSLHTAEPLDAQVGKTTLYETWQTWKAFMPFRNAGQGKRRRGCALIDAERPQAVTVEEKLKLAKREEAHLDEIKADRTVNVRGNLLSEKCAKNLSSDGVEQLLKITIDGMDQAKFRVPRNLANSADLSKLWRPQLHVVGAIAWGHLERYFIMDSDIPKDSNMESTVLARVLDLVQARITRLNPDAKLPRSLIVGIDNTPREGKNQKFIKLIAYLKAKEKFDAEDVEFLPSGHSHNELDQRFSEVAGVISAAPVLEDKEELAEWIQRHVHPVRGRDLHVEILDGTWNFEDFLEPVDAQVHYYSPS